MNKLILNFKSKDTKKIKNAKHFLGGKGANLSEMGRIGLPVPPGFTISTKVCEIFYRDKKKLSLKLINMINNDLLKSIRIDLTFLHLVSKSNLIKRLKDRKKLNRYDKFNFNFYDKVQKGFVKIAKKKPSKYSIINSNLDII